MPNGTASTMYFPASKWPTEYAPSESVNPNRAGRLAYDRRGNTTIREGTLIPAESHTAPLMLYICSGWYGFRLKSIPVTSPFTGIIVASDGVFLWS